MGKILKKTKKKNFFFHCLQNNVQKHGNGTDVIPAKRAKGSVGEGEVGIRPCSQGQTDDEEWCSVPDRVV